MKREVELYIAKQKVDLADSQVIAFTHQTTDYTDPTAIKNTYSNTISLEGTKQNNALFKSIYNLGRTQVFDSGYFNPSKREDFELFVNGELIESGYAKLDEVTNTDGHIIYTVTLYGGLGSFFYSLAYDGEGGERKLDTLKWIDGGDDELNMTINKTTVQAAWNTLVESTYRECLDCGYVGEMEGTVCPVCEGTNTVPYSSTDSKYEVINFAPCYNGLPSDFDSNKVLIKTADVDCKVRVGDSEDPSNVAMPQTITEGTSTYSPQNGYILGELREEMTEWEMRDLRSYNQRPVLRVKKLIDAICDPENNGGYEVVLDTEFFNNSNPYYQKAWMTLPMLSEMGGEEEASTWSCSLGTVHQDASNEALFYYDITSSIGSNFQPDTYELNFRLRASGVTNSQGTTATDSKLYTSAQYMNNQNFAGITLQLLGYDDAGKVVAYSDVEWCTSKISNNLWLDFSDSYFSKLYHGNPNIKNNLGWWAKSSAGTYYWNNDIKLKLTNTTSEISRIKVMLVWNSREFPVNPQQLQMGYSRWNAFNATQFSAVGAYYGARRAMPTSNHITSVSGSVSWKNPEDSRITRDGAFSNMIVNKKRLLGSLDGNILSFLLSYTKLFGLYFVKDKFEKKVSILTRKSFYQNTIINIDKQVNRLDDIKVTPLTFDKKWLKMSYPNEETTSFLEKYKSKYNNDLGCQKINTGYNFDEETNDIYEGNLFINAVECNEVSKYFKRRNLDGEDIPTWTYNWTNCTYYKGEDTKTVYIGMPKGYGENYYLNVGVDYDIFPKMQLHNDNSTNNGVGVLCFFDGYSNLVDASGNTVDYYLTDDVLEMTAQNDGACWLYAPSVSTRLSQLPRFSRYVTTGNLINNAWDFGRSKELFVPTLKYGAYSVPTLYENYWQSYMNDLLDVDTRKVDCTVLLKGKIDEDCLRKFYYFDNSYWVMTKIDQYDPRSFDGTLCSFTKVQSISNYRSSQSYKATIRIELSRYIIDKDEWEINGKVYVSDGGYWSTSQSNVTPRSGSGEVTNFVWSIPENTTTSNRTFTITATTADGVSATATIMQLGIRTLTLSSTSQYWESDGGNGGYFTVPADKTTVRMNITLSGRMENEQLITDSNDELEYVSWDRIIWNSTTSSTGYMDITFEKNETGAERTGQYISFETITDYLTASVGLRQNAGTSSFNVTPNALAVDYDANSTGTLTITATENWTATLQ